MARAVTPWSSTSSWMARRAASTSSGTTTSPRASIRSGTPRMRSGATSGSGLVIEVTRRTSSSGRPSTRPTARMMRGVSSKPRVVMSPTVTPLRVMSALVATVLPCLTRSVPASSSGIVSWRPAAASRIASITPMEKSSGVVAALLVKTVPEGARTTTSVKVPPMSTPMVYWPAITPAAAAELTARLDEQRPPHHG